MLRSNFQLLWGLFLLVCRAKLDLGLGGEEERVSGNVEGVERSGVECLTRGAREVE